MADKTFVGGGGVIYRAPIGTQFPAYTTGIDGYGTKLVSAGFAEVGEVAEDGLEFSASVESKTVKNWFGNAVRVLYTGHTETLSWNSIDFTDEETQKAAYGDNNVENVAEASASHGNISKVDFKGEAPEACAWAVVMYDGKKATVFLVESGQTSVTGSSFTKDDVTKLPITLTATKGEGDATVTMLVDDGELAS